HQRADGASIGEPANVGSPERLPLVLPEKIQSTVLWFVGSLAAVGASGWLAVWSLAYPSHHLATPDGMGLLALVAIVTTVLTVTIAVPLASCSLAALLRSRPGAAVILSDAGIELEA